MYPPSINLYTNHRIKKNLAFNAITAHFLSSVSLINKYTFNSKGRKEDVNMASFPYTKRLDSFTILVHSTPL